MDNQLAILEGLLFLCGEDGLNAGSLAAALQIDEIELGPLLEALELHYQNDQSGIMLVCFGGKYKLVTKEWIYPIAQELFKQEKSAPLSSSALETLAIIAYRQPITRAEIEAIRGVGCEVMLKKLVLKELIREVGRSNAVGKPILYEVTEYFMDVFQLQSLKELPKMEAFEDGQTDLFNLEGV
jgi:segregation and condensation protein B